MILRSSTRTATVLPVAALLLATLPLPASAATGTGTAATTSVPLHVEAAGLTVDVGRLAVTATNDRDVVAGAPWSGVGLTLLDVDGTSFGQVEVRSDGTTSSEGLSESQELAIGSVSAAVGDVLATADPAADRAQASLTTLTTGVQVLDGLDIAATVSDVVGQADGGAAAATHTLTLAGIDLDLAHVLGEVLGQLPLADLVALAEQLGIEVPANIDVASDVVEATEALLVAVADAATRAGGVEEAAAALLGEDGGVLAELQALQAAAAGLDPIGDPAGTVTALTTLLTDPTLPAACDGVTVSLATIVDDVAALVACLQTAVTDHVASLADAGQDLEDAVTAYADAVAAAVAAAGVLEGGSSSLGDIVDEIGELLTALLGADLFALGDLVVSQQVRAVGDDLAGSSASHECQLTTLTVLGQDPVEIAACDGGGAVGALVDTVTGALSLVLDTVGGIDAGDGVELELFGTKQDEVSQLADGTVRATSVMEVLALTVPDITIKPCEVADAVVCGLGLDLDATLALALGTVDGVLTTAQTAAEDALDSVSGLVSALGSDVSVVEESGAQAIVDSAIAALEAAVAGLDLVELGTAGGITVRGARVVVDPELEAEHVVAAPAGSPGPGPGDPGDPAPTPSDPSLPNTGGGAAVLAVLALGAGAWLVTRRRDA